MAKSVRINLSVPRPLYEVFAEVGVESGLGTAGAMLHALVQQAAFSRRWLRHWNFAARDPRGSQIEDRAGFGSGPMPPPPPFDPEFEEDGGPSRPPLSRQQKRQLEREERKRRR